MKVEREKGGKKKVPCKWENMSLAEVVDVGSGLMKLTWYVASNSVIFWRKSGGNHPGTL